MWIKGSVMPEKVPLLTDQCYHESMSKKTFTRTKKTFFRSVNVPMIIALLVIFFTTVNSLPHDHTRQRTIRLCSKSLSDALYLICHDRGGYNEPFSYNGEDEIRVSTGPGLVEECCYRPCSYEQLEQYCKPLNNDKNNDDPQEGIAASLRIVNLPYISMGERATKRRTVTSENNDRGNNKSKDRSVTILKRRNNENKRKHAIWGLKGRKKMSKAGTRKRFRSHWKKYYGTNNAKPDNDTDSANDTDVNNTSRRFYRRHRRPKRPHRHKDLREAKIAEVPKFKVGTTLPEPKDSILNFPSRTYNAIESTAKDFVESLTNFEKIE